MKIPSGAAVRGEDGVAGEGKFSVCQNCIPVVRGVINSVHWQ